MELSKNIKDGFIELVFGPRWTYIAAVRSFLQSFLAIALTDCKKSTDNANIAASYGRKTARPAKRVTKEIL